MLLCQRFRYNTIGVLPVSLTKVSATNGLMESHMITSLVATTTTTREDLRQTLQPGIGMLVVLALQVQGQGQ